VASQQNVDGIEPVFSFNDTELFLAINPETPEATVEKLNAGLKKVHESGMFEAIETKYGL
jgi:polar amino acid transport system substrate-binding protein